MKRVVLFCCLWIFLFLPHRVLLAQVVDRVVAVVNSEIITQHDLKQAMASNAKKINEIKNSEIRNQASQDLKKIALKMLIEEKLLIQEIKRKNIQVSDQEVSQAIANVAKGNHFSIEKLKSELRKQGVSFPEYQNQIRSQLIRYKFMNTALAGKVQLTDADYDRFLNANGEQLINITDVTIGQIILPLSASAEESEINKAIDTAILIQKKAGSLQSFKKLASKYSVDPSLAEPSKYLVSALQPEIARALPLVKEGGVTKPVRTAHGLHIVYLKERNTTGDIDRNLIKNQIHEQVVEYKMQEALQKYVDKLKETAYIEVKM